MFSIVNDGNSALCREHQFAACWNSCGVFGELVLHGETSTFFASDAKCFQLSVKLFSHPFFYVTHNSTEKYNVTYVLGRKKLLFLDDKCVGRTIVHPAAHLCISSRLLASLEALPSFAVPTRYESHVLSIGFVK